MIEEVTVEFLNIDPETGDTFKDVIRLYPEDPRYLAVIALFKEMKEARHG